MSFGRENPRDGIMEGYASAATAVAAAPASAPRAKFTADIECSIDIASSALTHCAGEVRDGRQKRRDALLRKKHTRSFDASFLFVATVGRPTKFGLTHSGVVTEFRTNPTARNDGTDLGLSSTRHPSRHRAGRPSGGGDKTLVTGRRNGVLRGRAGECVEEKRVRNVSLRRAHRDLDLGRQ